MTRSGRESSGLDGRVVAVLAELAESGRAAAAGAVAEEVASCPAISEAALSEVRGLLSSQTVPMEVLAEETVWQALIAAGVPTSNVARRVDASRPLLQK